MQYFKIIMSNEPDKFQSHMCPKTRYQGQCHFVLNVSIEMNINSIVFTTQAFTF